MPCSRHAVRACLIGFIGAALATAAVSADEPAEYQRVASHKETAVEVTGDVMALAQPATNPTIAVGGLELQLGLCLWNRWDLDVTGRLPVDVVTEAGETYEMYRSEEGSVVVGTAYSFGPPHRRHRIGASLEPRQMWNLSYVIASIRDPMVQGAGITADMSRETGEEWEVAVRVPLSVALVVNDVTSVQAELTPAAHDVLRKPRGTLSAVISVRWAWERFNIGSAALFGEHGAPGGMAFSGGWKWRREK